MAYDFNFTYMACDFNFTYMVYDFISHPMGSKFVYFNDATRDIWL
jgi:hypothetical protein